jgi:hypothetical protein
VLPPPIPAPEPSSWVILGLGAAGLWYRLRRKTNQATTI